MVHRSKFLNSVPKDGQTVQTSYAAFHLGLHYLPKYLFTGISRMKRVNVRLNKIGIQLQFVIPYQILYFSYDVYEAKVWLVG